MEEKINSDLIFHMLDELSRNRIKEQQQFKRNAYVIIGLNVLLLFFLLLITYSVTLYIICTISIVIVELAIMMFLILMRRLNKKKRKGLLSDLQQELYRHAAVGYTLPKEQQQRLLEFLPAMFAETEILKKLDK